MSPILFYKGVLVSDLKDYFIPGTVTRDFQEALLWKERAESKKTKGIYRHVRKGKATIIAILIEETTLVGPEEFQRAGVTEHNRKSCWLAADKTKAQINFPVTFEVVES